MLRFVHTLWLPQNSPSQVLYRFTYLFLCSICCRCKTRVMRTEISLPHCVIYFAYHPSAGARKRIIVVSCRSEMKKKTPKRVLQVSILSYSRRKPTYYIWFILCHGQCCQDKIHMPKEWFKMHCNFAIISLIL